MNPDFKQHQKSIKRKHVFGKKPKYEESFQTTLDRKYVLPLILEVLDQLEWMVVFRDGNIVEAKVLNKDSKNEKLILTHKNGKVKVESHSLDMLLWDVGRNSKRVRLFIYAFQKYEKEFTPDTLNEKLNKLEQADHYEIPDSLPSPGNFRTPNFGIIIIGALVTTSILSLLFAFVSVKFFNILLLYEILFGVALGYMVGHFIKMSNYTKFNNLRLVVVFSVVLYFISNLYFQYLFIGLEHDIHDVSFLEYIELRFENGLTLDSLKLGAIGLVVSWIAQLVFAYFTAMYGVGINLLSYYIEKVPQEVADFGYHHLNNGKTESQLRSELVQMGWKRKEDQDSVFDAINAIVEISVANRE